MPAWLQDCALLLAELARGREGYTGLNNYFSLWMAYRYPEDLSSLDTAIFSCSLLPQSICNFYFDFFQSQALFPALRHAFHFGDVRWSVINWQYVLEQWGDEVHFNETKSYWVVKTVPQEAPRSCFSLQSIPMAQKDFYTSKERQFPKQISFRSHSNGRLPLRFVCSPLRGKHNQKSVFSWLPKTAWNISE